MVWLPANYDRNSYLPLLSHSKGYVLSSSFLNYQERSALVSKTEDWKALMEPVFTKWARSRTSALLGSGYQVAMCALSILLQGRIVISHH